MNWDSWLEPKNSLITAETSLALMISWGIKPSDPAKPSRSLTARSNLTNPIRN